MNLTTLLIAWRNLGRNRKRTFLAVAAIAIGQFVVVFINGMMAGMFEDIMETVTGPLVGHVQVHHADWREERAVDLYVDRLALVTRELEAIPEVTSVSPRIYSAALVASGEETGQPADAEAAMLIGLDVSVETAEGGILASLEPHEYPSGRSVVVGKILARRLALKPGHLLAVIGQDADEFPVSDLFEVKAIVQSSVDLVNRLGVVMSLDTAQEFLALDDQAHEILIQGEDSQEAEALASAVAGLAPLEGTEVLPWREAAPQLAGILDLVGWFDFIFIGILFVAASAGIANTMMMSTYERSHEFGMLLALGSRPGRVVWMIVLEAVVLGLVGVAIGSALGSALVLVTSHTGLDYSIMAGNGGGNEVAFQGLTFSYMIYPKFMARHVFYGMAAVTLTSVLASLWPAAMAARLHPAEAMRS